MLKSFVITVLLLFCPTSVFSQEFIIIDNPVLHYAYDKYNKVIYYRDYYSGEIYKTGIDSSYSEFYFSGEYIHFDFFNITHRLALLKFVENQYPKRELYFYNFENDSLLYKTTIDTFSALGLSVSPRDHNILFFNEEPSLYSIIGNSFLKANSKLFLYNYPEWRNDSSFFFISSSEDILQYNYSNPTIDSLVVYENILDQISAIAYNSKDEILAYAFQSEDGNLQVILYEISTGDTITIYDLKIDDKELYGQNVIIREIKWSPEFENLAFLLRYTTIPASDIVVYSYVTDTRKRFTNWNNNYGVKNSLNWINQDTIIYEYDDQIYGFNLNITTDISELNKPADYNILIRNYPNPFNSSTNIEVSLPNHYTKERFSINIFTATGQLLFQSNDYQKKNNKIIFKWDSQLHQSNPSSGAYFLRLSVVDDGKSRILKSHKLILIK